MCDLNRHFLLLQCCQSGPVTGGRGRGVRRQREEANTALSSHNTRLKNKPALLSVLPRSEQNIPPCGLQVRCGRAGREGSEAAGQREAFESCDFQLLTPQLRAPVGLVTGTSTPVTLSAGRGKWVFKKILSSAEKRNASEQ